MGQTGSKGDKGPQGLKGDTGPKGQDGVLTLDSLNVTQFDRLLKSILDDSRSKGPKGDTGQQGVKGDTGPQGVKGDTGIQGIQGIKGDKGDKGDTGSQGTTGVFDTTKPYTFTQPQNFGDINVSGTYKTTTSRGTELNLRPDTDDYAVLTTKAGVPGGSHFNINPVFGGNVRIGYNPNEFLGAQSGTKDTNVPNTKLAVKGDINASNGFQTGIWKISESGDNLCMQNGTNPPFCINKYGEPLNKYLISFPWIYSYTDGNTKKCIDISKIGQNRPTSDCDPNDTKQQFYFEEGGKIKSADTGSYKDKCLQYSNNKYNVSTCNYNNVDTAYNEQLFGTLQGRIRPYVGNVDNGCFDRLNSNNAENCFLNDNINKAAQLYTKVKL